MLAATSAAHAKAPLSAKLHTYLQAYATADGNGRDPTTRVAIASVSLRGGAEEVFVYFSGDHWCGNGGCHLLILEPRAASFKPIGSMWITWPPIRVLTTWHHGHPDISVGISESAHGYESRLSFDGTSYPDNPSAPPAHWLKGKIRGKVVIAGLDDGALLWP